MFLKTQILSLVSISLIGVIVLTTTLVYVSAEPSSCIAPPSGMIGWWPGDGNANDIKGSSSSTIDGNVSYTTSTNGKVDNAFNFTGNGHVISSLNSLGGNGSGTMDFWIKNTTSSITPGQHIVGISNLFRVETFNNGQLGFIPTVNTTSGIESPSGPFLFPADMNFHHVAVVYDSSIARGIVYLDGQQVELTAPMPPGTKLVSFGQGNLTVGDSFKGRAPFIGLVDEIELFNLALTQAQIQSIFNAGSEGKCKPPIDQSPNCSDASPSESRLWPPNHTMRDISINGVIDPDGDDVTITVKKILQDEPTKVNPGDKAPDGEGIGNQTAKVRSERLEPGDGRVYHMEFNAEDGKGGMCESEVTVSVPPNESINAIDSGATFDSTLS